MERFFGFCLKKRHILTKFELCKKFSALGQNQRDACDYLASGRGCVMRDCRIERNTTVLTMSAIMMHPNEEHHLSMMSASMSAEC